MKPKIDLKETHPVGPELEETAVTCVLPAHPRHESMRVVHSGIL